MSKPRKEFLLRPEELAAVAGAHGVAAVSEFFEAIEKLSGGEEIVRAWHNGAAPQLKRAFLRGIKRVPGCSPVLQAVISQM